MTKENNKVDINKHEMDIDTLKKQNVNDLLSIKELYKRIEELGEKTAQIKYIDNTLVKKLKKEYENLKKIILDENIQIELSSKIEDNNLRLNENVKEINSQLDKKVSFPVLEGEKGVVNICYEYGDVKRYGAIKHVKNENIDDSLFFQNAIDSAFALKTSVKISSGHYTIKNTLYLPSNITIVGNSNKVSYRGASNGSVIEFYGLELFKPKNGTSCVLNMKNIYFYNRGIRGGSCFCGFTFSNTIIENCSFHEFFVVFLSGISQCSHIKNNDIQGIKYAFYCATIPASTGVNITTTAPTGIVDSFIEGNYINGNKAENATCFYFKEKALATSFIHGNYIDFFKTVFYLQNTESYSIRNNLIEWFWRCFTGKLNNAIIEGNILKHSKKSKLNSIFTKPDDDILTKEFICFSGNYQLENDIGYNRMTISNNYFEDVDSAFYITGANKYNLKIANNVYDADTTFLNKIYYNVNIWGNGIDQTNVFIDDLNDKKYDILPSSQISGGTKDCTTFNNQRIIYNNKILTNINGIWRDGIGNEVTE